MRTSETITKIAPALVKAQGAMEGAAKAAVNPQFKSKYANLEAVIDAVKGPLGSNGIAFLQSPVNSPEGVSVTTRFQHESGEFMEETIFLPVPTQTPQAYGSAITYAKRYGLQSMCGIPSEDDDGEAASAPKKVVSEAIPANVEGRSLMLSMSAEEQDFIRSHADTLMKLHAKKDARGMVEYVQAEAKLDGDETLALWSLLPSDLRSAFKKAKSEMTSAMAA